MSGSVDAAASSSGVLTEPQEGAAAGLLRHEDCLYAACYCEENVYKLCKRLLASDCAAHQLHAVFISNAARTIPLWCQRAGRSDRDRLVVWDYHVLLVQDSLHGALVWDLDTTLSFPCTIHEYARRALHASDELPPHLQRWYRVVPATPFLQHFASDRSHMISANGSYSAPPPPWPCIQSSTDGAAASNLFGVYLAGMDGRNAAVGTQQTREEAASAFGAVMDEASFLQRFGVR